MPRIAILGNIGSGKTELANELSTLLSWKKAEEPVQQWIDSGFLAEYYNDIKRYAFSFQIYAFITRLMCYERTRLGESCIMDSHVLTDKALMRAQVKLGLLTDKEAEWYESIYNDCMHLVRDQAKPDIIIYLQCSPQVCHQRMQERNRIEEKQISIEYLTILNNELNQLITQDLVHEYKVLTIDATKSKNEVLQQVQEAVEANKENKQ